MLSKERSIIRLPSPVSVFGTWKAARGFAALSRASKLSTSMSRNLRSATSGSGSAGLPERLANTPMTKGSWIFFSAPYSSTSYSIWTRGARFRAMNFWLLAFAMSHLLGARRHLGIRAAGALRFGIALLLLQLAGQLLQVGETVRQEVPHDVDEVLGHQSLRSPDEERSRIARLV